MRETIVIAKQVYSVSLTTSTGLPNHKSNNVNKVAVITSATASCVSRQQRNVTSDQILLATKPISVRLQCTLESKFGVFPVSPSSSEPTSSRLLYWRGSAL